jgi:hypothetical protein
MRMSVVFRNLPDPRMVLYSMMLIALMLTRPTGLFGSNEIRTWWREKRGGRAPRPRAARGARGAAQGRRGAWAPALARARSRAAAARGPPDDPLRRAHRRQRLQPRDEPLRARRPHRPQRRGQDDDLQSC